MFLIYSDEYDESSKIIEEIGKILNIEPVNIRLYFDNKRRVDPETVNHDQQIIHNTHLYLTIKIEDQWEKLQDIFGYNIYDVDLEKILNKEEEERKIEEARKKEEEKKKKEAAEKVMEKHRKKMGNK
jgi:hypothetical protein